MINTGVRRSTWVRGQAAMAHNSKFDWIIKRYGSRASIFVPSAATATNVWWARLRISTRDHNLISLLGAIITQHSRRDMPQNQITLCCIWARWFKFSQFVQKTLWNQWGTCCLCQVKSWHWQKLGQGLTHIICLIWVLSIISRQPKILLAHLTTQVCHICSCLAILYDFSQWHLTLNQWQNVTSIF